LDSVYWLGDPEEWGHVTLIATPDRYICLAFISKTLIVFTAILYTVSFPFQFSILVYCFEYMYVMASVQDAFSEPWSSIVVFMCTINWLSAYVLTEIKSCSHKSNGLESFICQFP
jgi:hypothetical protein